MTKIPKKLPRDTNRLAKAILDAATSEDADAPVESSKVTAGRLGGKKGGSARAAKLTAARRSEIAKKAAATRWKNR